MGKQSVRRGLLCFNGGFALLFGAAFLLLTLVPEQIERHARDELVRRIAAAAFERYPELRSLPYPSALSFKLRSEAAEIRSFRDSPEFEAVVASFGRLCSYDCKQREAVAARWRDLLTEGLRGFDRALGRVEAWAEGRYRELMGELLAELRIFTGITIVLLLLSCAVCAKPESGKISLSLSAILSLSTILSAWLYLFQQNWLQTLLFADYVGWAYLAWALLMASALADIVFNKARVLRAFLEGLLNVAVSPCP